MKKIILILSVIFIFASCTNTNVGREIKDEIDDIKNDISKPISNKSGHQNADFIGEEKAKEIALNKAQISDDGVYFDTIELKKDNGKWHYEIEFQKGSSEYEVDVDALTGEIISFSKELNE